MFILDKLFKSPSVKSKKQQSTQKLIDSIDKQLDSKRKSETCLHDYFLKLHLRVRKIDDNPELKKKISEQVNIVNKKSSNWNHSDINVAVQSLESSIRFGLLNWFTSLWVIFLAEEISKRSINSDEWEVKRFIKQELYYFITFIWNVFFEIFEPFFITHFRLDPSNRDSVLEKRNENLRVFDDYICYFITSLKSFQQIYISFLKLISRHKISQKVAVIFDRDFQTLCSKLSLDTNYQETYKSSRKKIRKFHEEAGLVQKFILMTEVIPQVELDTKEAQKRKNQKISEWKDEGLSKDILRYLFYRDCSSIEAEMEYMEMLIEFRAFEKSSLEQLLEQFCFKFVKSTDAVNKYTQFRNGVNAFVQVIRQQQ